MSVRIRKAFVGSDRLPETIGFFIKLTGLLLLALSLSGCHGHLVGFLQPRGVVAYEERKLFFDTLALMLIVVLPVIIMSFVFVYHYQISHNVKDYKPDWSHSYFLESLWWGIPCIIILILAILTWKKTHLLDPYRPITAVASNQPPLLIQAIALPWKWLFIYPKQHIATINYLVVPVGQDVEYWMTTDNVAMSALFVPQLGSQIYAMAGMRTRLHLLANQAGTFDGLNTQFNGAGFSEMHFKTYAIQPAQFSQWVALVQKSPAKLSTQTYQDLLVPSVANKPQFFSQAPDTLFNQVVNLYMNTYGNVHPRSQISKGATPNV